MFNKEARYTLFVALVLCLVCSVLVSTVAVGLKAQQDSNKLFDRNKKILSAAGLYKEGADTDAMVDETFKQFTVKLVDIQNGKFATDEELQKLGIDPATYDQRVAAKDPNLSREMEEDPAGILRQEKYAKVYILEKDGKMELIVLPVHGYGLWGTLYGFLVLEGDLNTIRGLTFYSHKETPGLGAKVDTDKWKSLWPGKHAYNENNEVNIIVGSKNGSVTSPGFIDGLSGATLTTAGVHRLINFWLGEQGFAGFIKNLKAGEA
jgi:Na+-transporting NADH:ubiquinone oxidoreductase subunit C